MRRLLSLIAGVLVLLAAVALLRTWIAMEAGTPTMPGPFGDLPVAPPPGLGTAALALGLLLLGAFLAGEIAMVAGLPRVSGALLWGVLVGPELHATLRLPWPALLPRAELDYLELIDALAVSLIGLVAGSEIRIPFLRQAGGRIGKLIAADMAGVLATVGGGLWAAAGMIPLLAERTLGHRRYLVLLLAAMAVANSPAVVTAMLRETGATGVMARTALTMTVVKDLLLVILISGLLAAWSVGDAAGGSAASGVAWHLVGSMGVGLAFAAALALIAARTRARLDLVILLAGFAIALAGELLSIAPLLAGITAGFTLANAAPVRSRRLFDSIDNLLPTTYALFFAVAGARISIDALATLWPVAAGIVLLRGSGIWMGLWAGGRWAGLEGPVRSWLWTSMIPQAGVSIALAAQARAMFREEPWADTLHALLLSVVAIHELLGPPLLRLGLLRSGEVRR